MINYINSPGAMIMNLKSIHGFLLLLIAAMPLQYNCEQKAELPGLLPDGSIRLHNRWTLTPAGFQIPVGTLPLGMVVSSDGKYLAVPNNGYSEHFISIINLERRMEVRAIGLDDAFYGIAFSRSGDRLYVSGGPGNKVHVYTFADARTKKEKEYSFGDRKGALLTGLALTPDESMLLVCSAGSDSVHIIDLKAEKYVRSIKVGKHPYGVILSHDGGKAYVSNWGGRSVSVIDIVSMQAVAEIETGSHPNSLALSPDGKRLYSANANSDNISVIDTKDEKEIERISVSPYENAPYGSTPNALALSKDGMTLYAANADNNDVIVIDVSESPARIKGLIPTAWYPTGVAFSSDEEYLYILNGKGMGSKPNPRGPQNFNHFLRGLDVQYIPRLFYGTVSILKKPDEARLASYTKQVKLNNRIDEMADRIAEKPLYVQPVPIPRRVGEPSVIKHVIYIIKENRTYDQVLGDLPQGNGDSTLTLFPRFVSPNHHALAETFTLFDNFYVDAEVSANGHEWTMGAIATDFMEKQWPLSYSQRGGLGGPAEYPDIGYIFDMAHRKGISYRVYGEFVTAGYPDREPSTAYENLRGHFCPDYRGYDLSYKDVDRAKVYMRELKEFEANGDFPQLQVVYLPNDHTAGTSPQYPTPEAQVADNDLAFGTLVEALSRSKFWKETAIFVLEDDAQLGADHVDAHRSIAFVISPYIRRGYIDRTMYSTVSMLRTIELILGLPPMSQYDAAAVPMVDCFMETPDLTPYVCLPNAVPLDLMNDPDAYAADEVSIMNLKDYDAVPERRFNEILWKAIKGEESILPVLTHNRPSYRNDFPENKGESE